jgi:hypothetical protein
MTSCVYKHLENTLAIRFCSVLSSTPATELSSTLRRTREATARDDDPTRALEAAAPGVPTATRVFELRAHLPTPARWIVGSDAWAHDHGATGLHHIFASRRDVSLLLLETAPLDARECTEPAWREQRTRRRPRPHCRRPRGAR